MRLIGGVAELWRRAVLAAIGPWPWVAICLGFLWSGIAFNLWHDYKLTAADVTGDTANFTRAFAENINRTVEAVDQSLLFIRQAYQHDPDSLDDFNGVFGGRILKELQVQVAIANRNGDVVWSSLGPLQSPISIADREHFQAQINATNDVLYISRPVIGRMSKKRSIQFVRRILTRDNQTDGVAVISIDPSSLSRFYESISIGQGSVSLIRSDGVILAGAPNPEAKIGQQLSRAAIERLFGGAVSGGYQQVSRFDQVERIYSFRRLTDYPLAVTVGESVDEVFADYNRTKLLGIGAGVLLTLVSVGAGGVVHTQRRSLVRSRQALSATLENMSHGIVMLAADGTIATFNRQAVHLLNLPPSPGSADSNRAAVQAWIQAHMTGQPLGSATRTDVMLESDCTDECDGPAGTTLEVRTRRLRDGRAVITVADITARKASEAALADAQARAAHAERMQALGHLAGGIAHDFNNILQVVQGAAALIERRSDASSAAERLARMIVDATERGTSITRRLLAFARKGELRAEPIRPAALLEDLMEVLRHTLGILITVDLRAEPDLPLVSADKGQLETVLVNLATNARDAMPDGGRLTLSASREIVTGRASRPADLRPGEYVRFSIVDTGIGMNQAILQRVTEPFFTTKPVGQGTGLGLPMAKGFAEQSGGGLLIDSAPGEGTSVQLWLPALSDTVVPKRAAIPRGRLATGTVRHVLLVDDEELIRETLAMALQDAGFAVTTARSGLEALQTEAAGAHCDVLITDLSMPGMGGLAVIKEMQARRPGLPAILLTGYAGQGAHSAVGDALPGSFSLMRKPVTGAQIADRIEVLLEQRARDDKPQGERARLTEV